MYERIPDELCASYAAGHQMHWIHWKRTQDAEPIPGELVRIDDDKVTIMLDPTGKELTYWHHDMPRLRQVIGLGLPIVAFPGLHALRVDGYMFNCHDEALTSPCRTTRTMRF